MNLSIKVEMFALETNIYKIKLWKYPRHTESWKKKIKRKRRKKNSEHHLLHFSISIILFIFINISTSNYSKITVNNYYLSDDVSCFMFHFHSLQSRIQYSYKILQNFRIILAVFKIVKNDDGNSRHG